MRKETISGEPDRTGSMPWMCPSCSNRSLNNDFVIAADLHHGAGDLPQIRNANLVGAHSVGRNMNAGDDKPLSVLLDLSHDEQGRATPRNSDRRALALAGLIEELDLNIFRVPSFRDTVCQWLIFSSPGAPACQLLSLSHVQIRHAQRVVLDELAARLDDVAHQLDENVVSLVDLADLDLQERAGVAVEGRLPQLILVHFAQ